MTAPWKIRHGEFGFAFPNEWLIAPGKEKLEKNRERKYYMRAESSYTNRAVLPEPTLLIVGTIRVTVMKVRREIGKKTEN